jgi:hypothetical protein
VTPEIFDRVQQVLDGKRPTVTPHERNSEDFPLRRFVRCAECGGPLTGSWSKGRKKLYAYYHCLEGCTRVPKYNFEASFSEYIGRLQPNLAYLRLFNGTLRDVWKSKQAEIYRTQARCDQQLRELRIRKTKLEEAFVYEHSIEVETYREMRNRLLNEIAALEEELTGADAETLEVDAVIEYAETTLLNAAEFWRTASLDQKQRLQRVLFPEGVEYSVGTFGTSTSCLLFSGIEAKNADDSEMVGPCGLEPQTSTVSICWAD